MSQQANDAEPSALRGSGDLHDADRVPESGGTVLTPSEAHDRMRRRVANPDDPPTQRPPHDARGPRPGPDFRGAPGRIAIVQGQVYLVGFILVAQLFLITTALFELLSGRTQLLWWIAGASLLGFLIATLIALWPSSRVKGF
jgi:hypothetical protein